MDLTDAQWAVLEPIFRPRRRPDGRGRPWAAPRAVLNGVLWILRTGAPWHDLRRRYPPYQTCHRRFQVWQRSGRLELLRWERHVDNFVGMLHLACARILLRHL
jgi:transposase